MNISGFAALFRVNELDIALDYYRYVLGFHEEFRVAGHAGLTLHNLNIDLIEGAAEDQPVGGSAVYVYCDEVDRYFTETQTRGAIIISPPALSFYGLRDFTVADLDGNRLTFGCDIAP